MKSIIIEANIPFVGNVFEGIADWRLLPPQAITPEAMRGADALITRTRTRCDAALLEGSPCSIVATATIGTDHIDLDYCRSRGIEVRNAPGCNAPAVAQYVLASLLAVEKRPLADLTIGVVGVGHVGSIVADWASQLGMKVLLCDPPRALSEGADRFVDLARIAAEADIITFHTPLTDGGDFPTRHMADRRFFESLRRSPIIVNSARGPIVDTEALVSALDSRQARAAIIDCWEGEPAISEALLSRAAVATPHIAGYSLEGKKRATVAAVNAVMEHFGFDRRMTLDVPAGAAESVTADDIAGSYDPLLDTRRLKADPAQFEALRNHYDLRHEVNAKKF